MVGILLSYWEGLFSGATLVSGRVCVNLVVFGGYINPIGPIKLPLGLIFMVNVRYIYQSHGSYGNTWPEIYKKLHKIYTPVSEHSNGYPPC